MKRLILTIHSDSVRVIACGDLRKNRRMVVPLVQMLKSIIRRTLTKQNVAVIPTAAYSVPTGTAVQDTPPLLHITPRAAPNSGLFLQVRLKTPKYVGTSLPLMSLHRGVL